ncbi:hypothetical protein HAX54_003202 [Datura stramonium]|uniref:Uncharacterized protein n=1 Tax=Datura stramonium TaxID=4076 RepID=A0ABS8T506_DATST|nr:hypothetical protein [Datura stramonium]
MGYLEADDSWWMDQEGDRMASQVVASTCVPFNVERQWGTRARSLEEPMARAKHIILSPKGASRGERAWASGVLEVEPQPRWYEPCRLCFIASALAWRKVVVSWGSSHHEVSSLARVRHCRTDLETFPRPQSVLCCCRHHVRSTPSGGDAGSNSWASGRVRRTGLGGGRMSRP